MSAASDPNVVSPTGITAVGNSEANCEANTIRATVHSNSPEATASGISTNENSTVRAHDTNIMATIIGAAALITGVFTRKTASATGISIKHGSDVALYDNIIRTTVKGDPKTASATGIFVDKFSSVRGKRNEITTTIIGSPRDNCNDNMIIANFVCQHPYVSCGLLCGFVAGTTYLAYRYFSEPGPDEKGKGDHPHNIRKHSTGNPKEPRWTRQRKGGVFYH